MNFYILILLFSISCTKTINLSEGFQKLLVEAASDRLNYNISYDGRYINIVKVDLLLNTKSVKIHSSTGCRSPLFLLARSKKQIYLRS